MSASFRPIDGGEPIPPPFPARVKAVMYAFALYTHQQQIDEVTVMAGGSIARRR